MARGTGLFSRTGWGMISGLQLVDDGADPSNPRYTLTNTGCAVTLPRGPFGHRLTKIECNAIQNVTRAGVDVQGQNYRLVVVQGDLPSAPDIFQFWNTNFGIGNGWPASTPKSWANQLPLPVLFDNFYQVSNGSLGTPFPLGSSYQMINVDWTEGGPSVPAGEALTIMWMPVAEGGNGAANPSTFNFHWLGAWGVSGARAQTQGDQLGSNSASLPRFDVAVPT